MRAYIIAIIILAPITLALCKSTKDADNHANKH